MLPKRPVSCLALLIVPLGLVLVLILLAGYALKFLLPPSAAPVEMATSTQTVTDAAPKEIISRLPATIPTTTTILVATASADVVKEKIYSIDVAGTPTEVAVPAGFRPEQWRTEGILLMPPDEAVVGSPWRVTGNNWNVPLRTRGGSIWQDPVILGRFTSGRLAIVAYRTQRALLSVGRSGDIQVVEVLDDTLSPLTVQGAFAWFVKRAPTDESPLELLPTGPSALIRFSETGASSTVAQDPALILDLVPGPTSASLAYQTSDGSLVIVEGNQLHSSITGWRPQAWLNERYLLVSAGKRLAWVDAKQPTQVIAFVELPQLIRGVTLSADSGSTVVR